MNILNQNIYSQTIPIASLNENLEVTGIGTAFVVRKIDNRALNYDYLVTAKHNLKKGAIHEIQFYWKDDVILTHYKKLDCKTRLDLEFDVSIIQLNKNYFEYLNAINLEAGIEFNIPDGGLGLIPGTEVYYFGYPFLGRKFLNNNKQYIDNDFKNIFADRTFIVPLVKKAILMDTMRKDYSFLLDTVNNPGFSGGPICIIDKGTTHVIGVITEKLIFQSLFDKEHGFEIIDNQFKIDENMLKNSDIGIAIGYSTMKVRKKILELDKQLLI
jgi:hypothetical protein